MIAMNQNKVGVTKGVLVYPKPQPNQGPADMGDTKLSDAHSKFNQAAGSEHCVQLLARELLMMERWPWWLPGSWWLLRRRMRPVIRLAGLFQSVCRARMDAIIEEHKNT